MADQQDHPRANPVRSLVAAPVRLLRRILGTDAQNKAVVDRIDMLHHQSVHGFLAPTHELLDLTLRRLTTLEAGVQDLVTHVDARVASLEEQVSLLRTHLNASGVMGPMNRKTKELEELFQQADAIAPPRTRPSSRSAACAIPFESPTEGASTLYFARWCRDARRPFVSVDTEKDNLETARKMLAAVDLSANFVQAPGEEAIAALNDTICLLYLDGGNEPEQTLTQFQAAEARMTPGCVVAIDDVQQIGPHELGKGTAAIPYAQSRGWQVRIMATEPGYKMAILTRGEAGAK